MWCAAGCTPAAPVGSTGGGGGGGSANTPSGEAVDSLLVVPHRSLYKVNDMLKRNDFSAFVHYADNSIAKISTEKVTIGIIDNLNNPGTVTPVPPENQQHLFSTDGAKGVVVSYNDVSAQYTVQVIDPLDIGGGSTDGGNGPGVSITW